MKNNDTRLPYLCPICQSSMTLNNTSWGCINGHKFDCAKEGYVNLLAINKKHSKDPGDNKEMMLARRMFLEKGFYQHLSERLNELAYKLVANPNSVLDLGCGEGYYTARLQKFYQNVGINADFHGLDISKAAIRFASKRYSNISFCVSSVFDLPFANDSFDLCLRVFAPSNIDEIARVLNKNAVLITVSPGKYHHYAIKKIIYDTPRYHENVNEHIDGFKLLHQENLLTQLKLTDEKDILNFLQMTPYAWKFDHEQKLKLAEKGLECELDFHIQAYIRC